jgi:hypothetical protein
MWGFPIDPRSNRLCDMTGITDPASGKVMDVAHAPRGCVCVSNWNFGRRLFVRLNLRLARRNVHTWAQSGRAAAGSNVRFQG